MWQGKQFRFIQPSVIYLFFITIYFVYFYPYPDASAIAFFMNTNTLSYTRTCPNLLYIGSTLTHLEHFTQEGQAEPFSKSTFTKQKCTIQIHISNIQISSVLVVSYNLVSAWNKEEKIDKTLNLEIHKKKKKSYCELEQF